jgi:phosphoglycerol transferase
VLRAAAAGVVVSLLVGVTGGVSSLARVFVTSNIRAWNRMSVLIAFFSLFAVAVLLEAIAAKLSGRPRGRLLFGALAVAVVVFGLADQTGSYFVPPYKADAREFASDSTFMSAVQRRLPQGASVFDLPYVPFPEGYQPFTSPGQTIPATRSLAFEYDEARLYVHSAGLRWSYGAMKGRPADWEAELAAKPAALAVIGAAAAGFQGVVVENLGYPGALGPEVRGELQRELGVVPITSPERDVTFYDLRPLTARLRARYSAPQLAALRAAVLKPLVLRCTSRRLTVVNPDRVTHTATLSATVKGQVLVRVGAGGWLPQTPGPIQLPVSLPPGATTIALSTLSGAAPASLFAPTVTDSAFAPFKAAVPASVRAGIIGPPCASVTA